MSDLDIVIKIVELLGGCLMAVLWWNFKAAQADLKTTAKDIADFKYYVAQTYVTQPALKELVDAIFKKLDRIEDKLDGKVDKEKQ